MKRNIVRKMDLLNVDSEIRDLVRQMWKHCYEIRSSCQGHGPTRPSYVLFIKGDGWFENNAHLYGLEKIPKKDCCIQCEKDGWGFCCGWCRAGIFGHSTYEGRLIPNPFKPLLF